MSLIETTARLSEPLPGLCAGAVWSRGKVLSPYKSHKGTGLLSYSLIFPDGVLAVTILFVRNCMDEALSFTISCTVIEYGIEVVHFN